MLQDETLNKSESTVVKIGDLNNWVIWQYPILREPFLCGAVCCMDSKGKWHPALINRETSMIKIFGHVKKQFRTPESAAEWLNAQSDL